LHVHQRSGQPCRLCVSLVWAQARLRNDRSIPHQPVRHSACKAGPVPDSLTLWPVDDGRYGLDATFQGAPGYQRAEHHERELSQRGVPYKFVQELDGEWTLRFGPLRAIDTAAALAAFVY
jgi:hypothetical protein